MSEPDSATAAQPAEPNITGTKAETQTSNTVHLYDTCPPERTVLRILLVSGQKTDIICNPSDSVEGFLKKCFEQWPEGNFLSSIHFQCAFFSTDPGLITLSSSYNNFF